MGVVLWNTSPVQARNSLGHDYAAELLASDVEGGRGHLSSLQNTNSMASLNIKRRDAGHRARLAAFVGVVLLCMMWLVWLVGLSIDPNASVNRLMNTETLDSGLFWLFVDPPVIPLALGATGLSLAELGHLMVLWRLFHSNRRRPVAAAPTTSVIAVESVHQPTQELVQRGPSRVESSGVLKRLPRDLKLASARALDPQSMARKRMALVTKLCDLGLQCVLLVQFMESGISSSLLTLFAASIASNVLATAAFLSLSNTHMGVTHLVVDFLFDLFGAVVFPVIVLANAFSMFTFDRGLMEINMNVFPLGSFEHAASVIANPVEVTIIRHFIDSLRIDSVAKVFTRVGTNLALCYHAYQLAKVLKKGTERIPQPSVYPGNNYRLGAPFVVFAVALLVFTERSITTSTAACKPHPECGQIARHWVMNLKQGDLTRCPCVAMIDRDIAVARYEDWAQPPNRTEKIAQLASSGYLRTLQLVNRDVSYLPEQLRRCKELRYVSLYYSANFPMPDWFRDFTKLEFLHLEGQTPQRSLQTLPDGLFNNMPSLALIHLASHPIPKLPSFDSLVNLKSLNLAVLRKIDKLPSFDSLRRLERLVLNSMTGLSAIPNLDHVHNLRQLISADRGAYCCNGFLGQDRCNLTHSLCKVHPLFKTPAVTQCLQPPQQASSATRAVFDRFKTSACHDQALKLGDRKLAPTRAEMQLCNGTMYRECRLPGSNTSAMCYNARWMGVSCDPTPFSIEMRRQQIAQRRGAPCDPAYEAWLGCGKA